MTDQSKFNWVFLIKGLILFLAGLFFMISPEGTIRGISFYIGLILVTGGLISLWNTYRTQQSLPVGPIYFLGPIIVLGAGLVLLFLPEFALTVFSISVGTWVLMDGVLQIRISREVPRTGINLGLWLLFLGILSVVIGTLILFNPHEFIKVMTILFGLSMLLAGGFMMTIAFSMRSKS